MELIPEIRSSHPGVVVEGLELRRPFLGIFGTPYWHIRWRLVDKPLQQSSSTIDNDAREGRAEIAGQSFLFSVRWRPDLRRARAPLSEPYYAADRVMSVAPLSVNFWHPPSDS
ncbi:MAG: hypothetical protein V2I82_10820 [Halieaceae bacterium]|jgi:hypothetical protein|nr:hypothetical protein [Halieaceae bacterium]